MVATAVPAVPTRRNRTANPQRWQSALRRALEEKIQVRQLVGSGLWIATSGTDASAAYATDGVTCECKAAGTADAVDLSTSLLATMRDALTVAIHGAYDDAAETVPTADPARSKHPSDLAFLAGRCDAYADAIDARTPRTIDLVAFRGGDAIRYPKLLAFALASAKAIGVKRVAYPRDDPSFDVTANGWNVLYQHHLGTVSIQSPDVSVGVERQSDGQLTHRVFGGKQHAGRIAEILAAFKIA